MTRTVDPLLLIGGIIVLAAALTWILPAGEYQRAKDAATGQTVVLPGSYSVREARPVGPWEAALAIPRGLASAAPVIFYVLIAGGALTVIEATGAVAAALGFAVAGFGASPLLLLPLISLLFVAGGATYSMYEEIIAFVPVLVVLMRRLGMDGITAVAVSLGSASVAAAFSPVNTFLLGISQPVAELPLFSGFTTRTVFFPAAISVWLAFVIKHAMNVRAESAIEPGQAPGGQPEAGQGLSNGRMLCVLGILNLGMTGTVAGSVFLRWELTEFTAVFVVVGVLAGLAGGLGWRKTSEAFAEGFRRLALAAALVGFARAITVVLKQGLILDTIANALFGPLNQLPREAAGAAMLAAQAALCFPMPSDSGRAMITLPILIPLADLLSISRQAVITAYQTASLVSGLVTPTGGTILAVLAMAGVGLGQWLRFLAAPVLALAALAALSVMVSVAR